MTMNKEEMQACFKGLGDTMAAAIGAALTANQKHMSKALKAAINARHEKSRPDLILPAQYPQLNLNKIMVHTSKDAHTTFLYSMSQLNSRMMLEGAFRTHLYTKLKAETNKDTDTLNQQPLPAFR